MSKRDEKRNEELLALVREIVELENLLKRRREEFHHLADKRRRLRGPVPIYRPLGMRTVRERILIHLLPNRDWTGRQIVSMFPDVLLETVHGELARLVADGLLIRVRFGIFRASGKMDGSTLSNPDLEREKSSPEHVLTNPLELGVGGRQPEDEPDDGDENG